ncbi:MAG: MarR family transcriptional regulator [Solirubrobacterales bacterium]|nr:MarR family transcriptional regulator [Solirubrobacterales bacterium]
MSSPEKFEQRMVAFVRAFGLHQPERTPCGEPIGVSQAHAITELAAQPLTQAELARRLQLDRSVVSRLADALIERGWMQRERHPHDQRAVQLVLTAAGERAAARVAGARRARMASLLDAVPADERDSVLHALDVLTRSLTDPTGVKEPHHE